MQWDVKWNLCFLVVHFIRIRCYFRNSAQFCLRHLYSISVNPLCNLIWLRYFFFSFTLSSFFDKCYFAEDFLFPFQERIVFLLTHSKLHLESIETNEMAHMKKYWYYNWHIIIIIKRYCLNISSTCLTAVQCTHTGRMTTTKEIKC